MVRSLTGTLTTAVGNKNKVPALTVTAEDRIIHLGNTTTTSNADVLNDMCAASDGSIIRVRVTRGANGVQQSFQWQRITDPSNVTQLQTWTTFAGGSTNMNEDAGCAISNNSGGTLRAFAQQGAGTALWMWTSTNNGSTWSGSPTTVLTLAGGANFKQMASTGNNDIFFLYEVIGGQGIGYSLFSGGVWSAVATWTLATLAGSSGLGVIHVSSTNYSIVYTDGYSIYQANVNTSGNSWTFVQTIIYQQSTAYVRFAPSLTLIDSIYQLVFTEANNVTLTGQSLIYSRLLQSPDLVHWSNGIIFSDFSGETFGTGYIKTTLPGGSRATYVMSSLVHTLYCNDYQSSDTTQYLDVSSKILDYTRKDVLDKTSTIALVLDNTSSTLTSHVSLGGSSYLPIGLNTTLRLSEGYKTGSPPTTKEVVNTVTYRITSITFERSPTRNQILIAAEDYSRQLDQRSQHQTVYNNQTLSYMISEICTRAGLFSISVPSTSQMSTNIVTFVLHANQKYRAALDELCRVGWLDYFMDQTETLIFKELSSGDSSVWSYTPEIESLTIGGEDVQANHIIVTGKPQTSGYFGAITISDVFDVTNAHLVGLERVIIDADQKLLTNALCSAKATFIMQQEQRDQIEHSITVPANPALQLLDVVTLTDQSAPTGTGLSKTSRIYADEVKYSAEKAEFEQTLDLEGV